MYFPIISDVEYLFMYLLTICILWENVYSTLCPLKKIFFLLNCMHFLYSLDLNPLLVKSFVNIFSHSICCVFVVVVA